MTVLILPIFFPFLGFLLLAFSGGRWNNKFCALISTISIGSAFLVTMWIGINFFQYQPVEYHFTLWNWISIKDFIVKFNLSLDALSLTMLTIVIGIGFIINLFSCWYMRGQEGFSRFFSYTNLFISSMNILVLADNLLFMYLGWELVGLCSYLLIGFYYTNRSNGAAALKVFIITRIGDICLVLAIFILGFLGSSLNFQDIALNAPKMAVDNKILLEWATFLLLCSAIGKSAQLPLHTWLSEAMVGPAPVSALIHAATMVTAGIYLIVRTKILFVLNSDILNLVGIIGAVTLLFAGCTALVQSDLKRLLAYSTMSQLGYMFLALGAQAWEAAIFHLVTHAFFKALLFLTAGAIILACNNEQNILKMGGLRTSIPFLYICFLVGGLSLASLPLCTSGFFSKEKIFLSLLYHGNIKLLIIALLGSLITSIYTCRMIFLIFYGPQKIKVRILDRDLTFYLPLLVLVILSTFIGTMAIPPFMNFNQEISSGKTFLSLELELLTISIVLLGIGISIFLWLSRRNFVLRTYMSQSSLGRFFITAGLNGWGFDWFFNHIVVLPYRKIAILVLRDPLQNIINKIPHMLFNMVGREMIKIENHGLLRIYITQIILGLMLIITVLLLM
ncbi:MAG: NADH-quinone oxidoreductase subunit L [Candidatus Dasytiphilus stammeri]